MNKLMVDTNILVYAYDGNSVFHAKAVAFLSDPTLDLYITTKNIAEFFAVLSKQTAPFHLVFKFYQETLANTTLLPIPPASPFLKLCCTNTNRKAIG